MEKKLLIMKEEIKPSRADYEVVGSFNPGCTTFEGETLLLIRVAERPIQTDPENYLVSIYSETADDLIIKRIPRNHKDYDFSDKRVIGNGKQNYLSSISHFRLARSRDGVIFEVSDKPTIFPNNVYESFGIEDPRITKIDDTYYITYSAISPFGINGCLIKTKDFVCFERCGIIFTSDNKDIVLFPGKIGGKYHALHRPSLSEYGKLDIWIAKSPNLVHWGEHRVFLTRRTCGFDNHRLGGSAVPFLTDRGWIEIYHSGNHMNEYSLALVLLDREDPSKVLMRSKKPLIQPEEHYETNGFFGNVVFSCGAIVNDHHVDIYYGASDESIAVARVSFDEIFDNLEPVEEE